MSSEQTPQNTETALSTQDKKTFALVNIPLVTSMAAEYGYGDELERFQRTLIQTVFPSDKIITNSQFLMFLQVAKTYTLDPLTKQIFAFPSKGGGIVPIVSIDGWIAVVQRQKNYSGHKFVYEWEDGKVGGTLLACTCKIFRKDLGEPIEHTEFMVECAKDTEPWKKWPRRMLTHKAFIQCARYAFGLSGIYDEDEGRRIIESEELNVTPEPPPIQQPQRLKKPSDSKDPHVIEAVAAKTTPQADVAEPEKIVEPEAWPEPVQENTAEPEQLEEQPVAPEPQEESDSNIVKDLAEDLFAEKQQEAPPTPAVKPKTIGPGRAGRIYAILNRHKVHTEDELKSEILVSLKIDHLRDLPIQFEDDIIRWAEGKKK